MYIAYLCLASRFSFVLRTILMKVQYLLLFLLLGPAPAFTQTSTFDTGNEGWHATGDPTSTTAFWEPTGGNPGGYIRVVDAAIGGIWYFEAPSRFTGNKCDAYDTYLRWDQFTSDTSNQFDPAGTKDVILESGTLTLLFDNLQNPGLDWTPFSILLREDAGWHVGNVNGPAPTQAQFQAVLSNLNAIRIQGEYRAQADFGGIDNFILESAFAFDLDGDDSSGAINGDFNADTTCLPEAPVIDMDGVLESVKRIDSIVLQLPFVQNPAQQQFAPGALPPGIAVQNAGSGRLTLYNTGNANPADFRDALKTIRYQDLSPAPARGTRIVSIRVYTECGNMGQHYAYLPVFPAGNAGMDADTTLCAGGPAVDLFAVLKGQPGTGGFWQPALHTDAGLFDPNLDSPGAFRYIIPDAGPCPGDTAVVSVNVEKVLPLRTDTTICSGDSLLLVIPLNLINWHWSDGSQNTVLEVKNSGIYSLEGQTEHCLFSDSVQVDFYSCMECLVYAPNIFSPNNDAKNDRWQVFPACETERFLLRVFDRWGNLVFETENATDTWDGQVNGHDVPVGVYGWTLEWEAGRFGKKEVYRKSGDVTVLR